MNNKSLFIGVVVFVAGIGAGYFIGVKRVKEQYKEDLAEVKDFYSARLEEIGVQKEGFDPTERKRNVKIDEETDELTEEMSEEYFNKLAGYSSAATKTSPTTVGAGGQRGKGHIVNYSKPPLEVVAREAFEQPEPDEEDEDERDEDYEAELDARAEELAQRRHENQSNGKPYTINHDEYEDAPENYTRNVLYYYSQDRTLCEDDDSTVDDEEMLIGFDYEDTLEMQTTAWVRNDALMNVYQIHRIDQSYARSVANVAETPREREFRILGRRKQGLDS